MRIPRLLAATALLAVATALPVSAQSDSTQSADTRTWSYVGPNGPVFWRGLPGYGVCGTGTRQSPVNLVGEPTIPGVTMTFPPDNLGRLLSKGYTVDLYLSRRGTLTTADSTFDFQEVHFHVPAEHTVWGHRYAAEVHAVYQRGTGNRAVLTTFVERGDDNGNWTTLIRNLPGNAGRGFSIGPVDLRALLSLQLVSSERMYVYAGSLTTPACEENVRFLIRERTIFLSQEQIDALASAMTRNVRPVQRTVHVAAP
jgi:carbonic anhydrase